MKTLLFLFLFYCIFADSKIEVKNQVLEAKKHLSNYIDTNALILNSQISCTFPCNVYLLRLSEYEKFLLNKNFTSLKEAILVNQTSLFYNDYDEFAKNTTLVTFNPQNYQINVTLSIDIMTPNLGSSIAVAIVSGISLILLSVFGIGICIGAIVNFYKN